MSTYIYACKIVRLKYIFTLWSCVVRTLGKLSIPPIQKKHKPNSQSKLECFITVITSLFYTNLIDWLFCVLIKPYQLYFSLKLTGGYIEGKIYGLNCAAIERSLCWFTQLEVYRRELTPTQSSRCPVCGLSLIGCP